MKYKFIRLNTSKEVKIISGQLFFSTALTFAMRIDKRSGRSRKNFRGFSFRVFSIVHDVVYVVVFLYFLVSNYSNAIMLCLKP